MLGAGGARLTATAGRPGTPAFMAPEQVSSSLGPLSSATDVWAMGAVLHELLAGVPPFADTQEVGEALLRRVTSSPPALDGDRAGRARAARGRRLAGAPAQAR